MLQRDELAEKYTDENGTPDLPADCTSVYADQLASFNQPASTYYSKLRSTAFWDNFGSACAAWFLLVKVLELATGLEEVMAAVVSFPLSAAVLLLLHKRSENVTIPAAQARIGELASSIQDYLLNHDTLYRFVEQENLAFEKAYSMHLNQDMYGFVPVSLAAINRSPPIWRYEIFAGDLLEKSSEFEEYFADKLKKTEISIALQLAIYRELGPG